MRIARKFIRPVGVTLFLVGIAGAFGEWCIAQGLFTLRGMNWPVRAASEAIRFPDGRYAIGISAIGRIQVYSPSREFLYGWQTGTAVDLLRLRPDGTLDVYGSLNSRRSRHRWAERVYHADGALASWGHSDRFIGEIQGERPLPILVPHTPPAWLVFPLYNPAYAGILAAIGGILTAITTPPELLRGSRRKLMYLPPRRW